MSDRHTKVGDKEYNLTQLKGKGHGLQLHRDYSAHFFRWSFARRYIKKGAHVLDVGCGQELPLFRILTSKLGATRPASYTGVDLNDGIRVPESKNIEVEVYQQFDIIKEHSRLKSNFYDNITCLEVIEHMHKEDGQRLLEILRDCVKDGGLIFLSTPVFNGKAAKNHIHEYTVDELNTCIYEAGLQVVKRFGTFMNVNQFKYLSHELRVAAKILGEYYDNDALSCIFAPANPSLARNNFWIITK